MSKKKQNQEEIVELDVMGTEVMTGATITLQTAWDVESLVDLLNTGEGEGEPTLVSEEQDADYDGAVVKVLWGFHIHDVASLDRLTEYAEAVSEIGEFEIVDD